MRSYEHVIAFIRELYGDSRVIPLHEPVFQGNERKYVMDAIDSTFVSSVGAYVNRFEDMMAELAGTRYAVATTNGTTALHLALVATGTRQGDEIITQPLTFIATPNAIAYTGAAPVFVDVDRDTLGLSPHALSEFLREFGDRRDDGHTYNKSTGRRIKACIPMHTFGMPARIDEIVAICAYWNIIVIEDAAESIGSYYKHRHTGSFGLAGIFSFNGNKTITCGGGGAIVTDNTELAELAKHLSTQAKEKHRWEFSHDQIGYNYRMPNLNAAMACAQLEQLPAIVSNKRETARLYEQFFSSNSDLRFVSEPLGSVSNNWLNSILLPDMKERDRFLEETNDAGVLTRPAWKLVSKLKAFSESQNDGLATSIELSECLVNLPSSVR